MPGVLFLCTGNLYRSPLAAAFFRARLPAAEREAWTIESAGTWPLPGQPVPPDGLRVAAEFGADLSGHRSQEVSGPLLARFDLILVMERGHQEALALEFPSARHKIHLFSQVVDRMDYDVPDPLVSGQELRILASDLHQMIARGYSAICTLAQEAAASNSMEGDPP